VRSQIFDVLLRVLGDGRLTGGQGRTVDFCDTILIRTSPGEAGVPNVRPWA
jgi:ATP-dependent Clp protease ATP-binding subunit ClpA